MALQQWLVRGFRGGCIALVVTTSVCALAAAVPRGSSARNNTAENAPRVMLRKCIEPDGRIAYQSVPCSAGGREAWSREAALTELQGQAIPELRERNAPRERAARTATGKAHSSKRGQCDAARLAAAQRRDREWNRLKFDDLSRLDAWVAERCR